MFRYGKKPGVMGLIAVVLCVVPLIVTVVLLPQMGDAVPMRFSASGEVLRWGSKFELLVLPVLCVLLGCGTFASAFRQMKKFEPEDPMAPIMFGRYMRNALVTVVVLLVANIYILFAAVTGHGIGI